MVIYYDTPIEAICFKFDPEDWATQRGVKFIEEIKKVVPEDYRYTEVYSGRELLWRIDDKYKVEFVNIYKRIYPFDWFFKTIKIYYD